MKSLKGMKVAVLETRMGSELAAIIRRHDGEPLTFPSLREVPLDCTEKIAPLLDLLEADAAPILVFSNAVGVETLFTAAESLGKAEALRQALRKSVTVCRGPKPAGVLARNSIQVSVKVPLPHTTDDVLAAMEHLPLAAQLVIILHHGERNVPLVEALAGRGARIVELMLYEWKLPQDLGPLRQLVDDLIKARLGAIVFTSQIQARHLFQVAAVQGLESELGKALRQGVIVASIGPTCTKVLESLGVSPDVVPQNPKMVPLVQALVGFVDRQGA